MSGASSTVILLCVILIPLALVLTIVFWTALNGIGPLPTTSRQKRAILAALPSEVEGAIYELGSGWGGLALELARKYTSCRIVGVENSPIPFLCSRAVALLSRVPNVELRWRNIREQPLHDAALIVCYLHTGGMRTLQEKLTREPHGSLTVICNTFSFHGWTPERVVEIGDIYRSKVFVYRLPASQ